MPGPLPHTNQIQEMMVGYLHDAENIVSGSFAQLKSSSQFRTVYRNSLAADAVLSKLGHNRMRPRLGSARSIVLRIPLLVGMRQIAVANIELRRFIELVFWSIYFTEHPIEWRSFEADPEKGFSRNMERPIHYCAHRESVFYLNYAKERMQDEPSGIAVQAIETLKKIQGELNSVVHPARIAAKKSRIPPFSDVSPDSLKEFGTTQRRVLSQACLVLAAFNRGKFDQLPPMHRAHFDWIVGTKIRKQIRGGPFGLSGKRSS